MLFAFSSVAIEEKQVIFNPVFSVLPSCSSFNCEPSIMDRRGKGWGEESHTNKSTTHKTWIGSRRAAPLLPTRKPKDGMCIQTKKKGWGKRTESRTKCECYFAKLAICINTGFGRANDGIKVKKNEDSIGGDRDPRGDDLTSGLGSKCLKFGPLSAFLKLFLYFFLEGRPSARRATGRQRFASGGEGFPPRSAPSSSASS